MRNFAAAVILSLLGQVAIAGPVIRQNNNVGGSLAGTVRCQNGTSVNIGSGLEYLDCTNNRIGINNTIPAVLLDVSGGAQFGSGVSKSSFAASGALTLDPALQLLVSSGSSSVPGMGFNGNTNNGIFSPATNVFAITTSGTERLRVSSTGDVGIGTTSPGKRLDVTTSGTANSGGITLNANSVYPADIRITDGVSATFQVGVLSSGRVYSGTSNNIPYDFKTNDLVRATIDNNGFVGISSTVPTALFVVGDSTGAVITTTGHIDVYSKAQPTVTCNLGSPTFVANSGSNDTAGKFNGGVSSANCTITFNNAFVKPPVCFCNDETNVLALKAVSTTSTLVCTSATSIGTDIVSYGCIGIR